MSSFRVLTAILFLLAGLSPPQALTTLPRDWKRKTFVDSLHMLIPGGVRPTRIRFFAFKLSKYYGDRDFAELIVWWVLAFASYSTLC